MTTAPAPVLIAVVPTALLPPVGEALSVEASWEDHALPIVVLRWFGRQVRGYVNLCPHMAVTLNRTGTRLFDRARRHLICATHGALFRPEDGRCVSGPCAGDHLDALEVVEIFGQLQVFLPGPLSDALRARRPLVTALGPRSPALDDQGPADPGERKPD